MEQKMHVNTDNGTIFSVEIVVQNERFEDILSSFFGAGANYWLQMKAADIAIEADKLGGEFNVIKQIMLGGCVKCYDIENTDEKLGELTLNRIQCALQAMANEKDLTGYENEYLKTHFNNFIEENTDAETADVIIQIAVMGRVTFG